MTRLVSEIPSMTSDQPNESAVAYPLGYQESVPQSLSEIPADLEPEYREMVLTGVLRRVEADKDLLTREISLRDTHIDTLQEDHETELAAKDAIITKLGEESGMSDFGGLLNKRAFERKASEIINAHPAAGRRKNEGTLVLGFGDVDDLKGFNTELTEPVVDAQILEPIALAMNANKRDEDVASNWGGDEYTELLQGVTAEQAKAHFRRLSKRVSEITVDPAFEGAEEIPEIQMSFGFVVLPEGMTYEQAVRCAARAKGYAKEMGKNMIVNFNDVPVDWVAPKRDRAS